MLVICRTVPSKECPVFKSGLVMLKKLDCASVTSAESEVSMINRLLLWDEKRRKCRRNSRVPTGAKLSPFLRDVAQKWTLVLRAEKWQWHLYKVEIQSKHEYKDCNEEGGLSVREGVWINDQKT